MSRALSHAARHARRGPSAGQPQSLLPRVCIVDSRSDDYRGWESAAGPCQLSLVCSADEALRVARNQAIDLWIVNVELPGLTGLELCGMLKSRDATPVYLVADEYSPELERAAWSVRATLFGCKSEVGGWLDQWLSHQRADNSPNAARAPRRI